MEKQEHYKMDLLEDYLSLQDRVYIILRDWILSGRLAPNDTLNTNQLSKQLNVSRTPVRDAVNKLVSMGLAIKENHKEARVADFMSEEMYEIFKVRSTLEGIAANSATRYMNNDQKEKLIYLVKCAEECSLAGDEDGFMNLDMEIHFLIYDSIKTPLLRNMSRQLYIIAKHNRVTGYHIEGRRDQVLLEHSEIVAAITQGDADKAEEAGYRHIYNSILFMRKKFENMRNVFQ